MLQPNSTSGVTARSSRDTVCVGFGTTGLGLAVALHEQHERQKMDQRRQRSSKVSHGIELNRTLFLERQTRSSYRPAVKLPGSHMQHSFLNDLITSENPRSRFTFLNYLQMTDQLVTFTNVSQMRAGRDQWLEYLRWCANQFTDNVRYGTEVVAVDPVRDARGTVQGWNVMCRGVEEDTDGRHVVSVIFTRKVVCAVGLQPHIPQHLSILGQNVMSSSVPSLVHSSECVGILEEMFRHVTETLDLAVIGNGQHAAEIFEYLHDIRGAHRVTWYMQDRALTPHNDTPFAGDIRKPTAPQSSSRIVPTPPEVRGLNHNKSPFSAPGNISSTADLHLIQQIYENLYAQSVEEPDSRKWRFQIRPETQIVRTEQENLTGPVRLIISSPSMVNTFTNVSQGPFDLVIAATGYERTEYKRILRPIVDAEDLLDRGRSSELDVGSEYKINLRRGAVKPGRGLWLLGSISGGDDADDAIFPILPERSRILAGSLLAEEAKEQDGEGAGDVLVEKELARL